MLTGPHRNLNIPMVRDRVRESVGVKVRGVGPAGTGPIGVLNYDAVP